MEFEKKNKTRFDNGKYIAIPGTVEWWINSYKKGGDLDVY